MSRIKRIYRHWQDCEEYKSSMWRSIPAEKRDDAIELSAKLMIDHKAFESACLRVLIEWPNSTECALSASVINHQAWIGHAACALNHDAPEDLTRQAWRSLTQEQQDKANAAADVAINHWKATYKQGV